MNTNKRFSKLMSFEKVDRLPLIEWAPYWDKTVSRWHEEGLSDKLNEPSEIREYFGFDRYLQLLIAMRGPGCPEPSFHGGKIIETENDYEQILEHLYPAKSFCEEMLKKWAFEQAKGDAVIWFTLEGFFWFARTLFGIEGHMYAFFDKPELMKRINQDLADFHLSVLDKICDVCVPDFMSFAEDMSYNHGPMLSKNCFDEFLLPYYEQVVPELKKRGIIPFVDSDGDVTELIPWIQQAGIEGLFPLERMAGVDLSSIREDHPNLRLMGGFDKTVMHLDEDSVVAEFERLLPVMAQGGFLVSVDHQTPPEVSLEQYKRYIELLKKYCFKAAEKM